MHRIAQNTSQSTELVVTARSAGSLRSLYCSLFVLKFVSILAVCLVVLWVAVILMRWVCGRVLTA